MTSKKAHAAVNSDSAEAKPGDVIRIVDTAPLEAILRAAASIYTARLRFDRKFTAVEAVQTAIEMYDEVRRRNP